MVIIMVRSSRENAMLSAVRALRRLLRKAFLATKWASVITHANQVTLDSVRVASRSGFQLSCGTFIVPGLLVPMGEVCTRAHVLSAESVDHAEMPVGRAIPPS